MKSIKDFEKERITAKEMSKFVGGMATEEILYHLWIGTPEGGSSTWTNTNYGCFEGVIRVPGNCDCEYYQTFCYAMP